MPILHLYSSGLDWGRNTNTPHVTLGVEFPSRTLSVVQWVTNSSITYVSESPLKIPDGSNFPSPVEWLKIKTGLPLSKATRLSFIKIRGFPSLSYDKFGFIYKIILGLFNK